MPQAQPVQPMQPRAKVNPWMISTLLLVGIIIGVGLGQLPIFDFFGSGTAGGTGANVASGGAGENTPSPKDYAALSKALEDDDTVYGVSDAPVTVVEFSDFQCPYCAASVGVTNAVTTNLKSQDPTWEPIVPNLLATYVKDGKVKFIYRDFPLDGHPQAQETAEAAECADEQGKFMEMHDKIFAGVSEWAGDDEQAKATLKKYASDLSLDTEKFNDCLDSGKYTEEVRKDYADGVRAGVSGTPTFYVNGREISGAQSFKNMASLIDELLKE